jgi:hypothetical protein
MRHKSHSKYIYTIYNYNSQFIRVNNSINIKYKVKSKILLRHLILNLQYS